MKKKTITKNNGDNKVRLREIKQDNACWNKFWIGFLFCFLILRLLKYFQKKYREQ
jgi:hypothetical protein